MANNYCQTSSFIHIPESLHAKGKKIEKELFKKFEKEDGSVCFKTEWCKETIGSAGPSGGLWIYNEEGADPHQICSLIEKLINELDIPGIHAFSFSYSCSKPRIDEFGGFAFAITKGFDPVWVDAIGEARVKLNKLIKKKKK